MPRNTSSTGGSGTIPASRSKDDLVRSKSGNNLSAQDSIRAISPTPAIARTNSGKLRSPGCYSDDIKAEVAKTAITRTRSPSPQGPPMLRTMERAARSARATSPQPPQEPNWNSSTSTQADGSWQTFGKMDLARAQAGARLPPKAPHLPLSPTPKAPLPLPIPDTSIPISVHSTKEGSSDEAVTNSSFFCNDMPSADNDETFKTEDPSSVVSHPLVVEVILPTDLAVTSATDMGPDRPVVVEDASNGEILENGGEAGGDSEADTPCDCAKQCMDLISYMEKPFLVETLTSNAETLEAVGPATAEQQETECMPGHGKEQQ